LLPRRPETMCTATHRRIARVRSDPGQSPRGGQSPEPLPRTVRSPWGARARPRTAARSRRWRYSGSRRLTGCWGATPLPARGWQRRSLINPTLPSIRITRAPRRRPWQRRSVAPRRARRKRACFNPHAKRWPRHRGAPWRSRVSISGGTLTGCSIKSARRWRSRRWSGWSAWIRRVRERAPSVSPIRGRPTGRAYSAPWRMGRAPASAPDDVQCVDRARWRGEALRLQVSSQVSSGPARCVMVSLAD